MNERHFHQAKIWETLSTSIIYVFFADSTFSFNWWVLTLFGFLQWICSKLYGTLPTQRCPVILGRLSCNSMLSCCRCENVFTQDWKMSFSNCQNNDNTPACKRNTFLFQACILLPQNVSICIRCSPFAVSILKWTQSQMASQAFGMSDGLMGALNCESY